MYWFNFTDIRQHIDPVRQSISTMSCHSTVRRGRRKIRLIVEGNAKFRHLKKWHTKTFSKARYTYQHDWLYLQSITLMNTCRKVLIFLDDDILLWSMGGELNIVEVLHSYAAASSLVIWHRATSSHCRINTYTTKIEAKKTEQYHIYKKYFLKFV